MRKEHKIAENVRKPKGIFGRKVAKDMNIHHESLARWGITHINIEDDYQILDIGCGGGRNVNRFAKLIHEGKVFGIDYSDTSIKVSSELNKAFIKNGIVEIKKGSVSAIPYEDDKFDLVTAFETYYFWPDLLNDLKEVLRVMKKDAKFLLVNEMYECENPEKMENTRKWANLCNFKLHHPNEFEKFLTEAGFTNIKIYENIEEGWITAVASNKSNN
jgi:SAM-dependent methyltransferase